MNSGDLELLHQYARRGSEDAFDTLVTRHLNLVYSAALRVVRSPALAEEVAQSVFTDLARNADQMKRDTILAAWLYRVTHRTAVDVVRRESRRQNREQKAVEMTEANPVSSEWTHLEPFLEEAMEALEETYRAAILLRHFENKSLREVGNSLGISEDAAQKRVSRAVDHLREFFSKRGVAVGSAGLVALLSTHAVQAAPVGLATAISSAVALSATVLQTSTTIGVTKTIAMTTAQKVLIAAATAGLAVTAGTSVYQTHHVAQIQEQLVALQQQQEPLAQQVEQLRQEREDAQKQIEQLRRDTAELPRLRGEVTRLQANAQELAQLKAPQVAGTRAVDTEKEIDPTESAARVWLAKVNQLKQRLEQVPDKKIPELQFLTENDWLTAAARYGHLETDDDFREAFRSLRDTAKKEFARKMGAALSGYALANGGQLPADVSQLAPYFQPPVDNAILQRYQVVHAGPLSEVSQEDLPVAEKAPVDDQYDTLLKIGPNGYHLQGTGSLSGMTGMGSWTSPATNNRSQGNTPVGR